KHTFFYFDLEKENFLELCNKGVDEIINYIKGRTVNSSIKKKIFVFIDEIQYLDNPTGLLKLFYDHHKDDFKLIVSGSSSFAIKSKFKDSLVGRIIDLEVFGLSFKEFLDFKGLKYDLASDSELINLELKSLYLEYALYGAYPQIVLTNNLELKEVYLKSIVEEYIYKDIRDLAEVKDLEKFNSLVKFLASQSGGLVNINELASTLSIARQTIAEYLFILESTYIIKLIHPFHKNIGSELSKMSKVYFEDLGILNLLRNRKLVSDIDGSVFENSVYAYLRRRFGVGDIFFWRTIGKKEVDFIINGEKIIPLEVKMAYQDKMMKNLVYFGEQYEVKKSYCVTMHKKECKINKIKQIYPWEIESLN
ncbi:MAG: ATP-binding protein, partial [Candidatus Falkowbacteria bacterium]|nr:ATP-binding protein [Candidatus Falkowbacteria bacterium]